MSIAAMSDGSSTSDRADFIRHHTLPRQPPHVPEITLFLADEAVELWTMTEGELETIGLPPPYWAFAWAGGQALARYLLDEPSNVRGRSVLDFAAGSGLVAIAAALAGATGVAASEIDPFAQAAIPLNAALNGVAIALESRDVLTEPPPHGIDVVTAGDVFYEKPMAERVLRWLDEAAANGADVLIGDPGRNYLPRNRLERIATYRVPVTRALEDADIKETSVWRLRPSRPALS